MKTKKELMLEAAIELIEERGFEATRVEDITNKAGVAKGTFYNYFKTKEDILIEFISEFSEIREKIFKETIEKNKDLKSSLVYYISEMTKIFINKIKLIHLMMDISHSEKNVSEKLKLLMTSGHCRGNKQVEDIIEMYIEELNPEYINKLEDLSEMFLSMTLGQMFKNLIMNKNKNESSSKNKKIYENVSFITDVFLKGIKI